MCNRPSADFTMQELKTCCCSVFYSEGFESIDSGTFKELIELLADQGLLLWHCNNFMSSCLSHCGGMQVRFRSQLIDIQADMVDQLEAKPIYRKLAESIASRYPSC